MKRKFGFYLGLLVGLSGIMQGVFLNQSHAGDKASAAALICSDKKGWEYKLCVLEVVKDQLIKELSEVGTSPASEASQLQSTRKITTGLSKLDKEDLESVLEEMIELAHEISELDCPPQTERE